MDITHVTLPSMKGVGANVHGGDWAFYTGVAFCRANVNTCPILVRNLGCTIHAK